jgi:hypothetical protein
MVYAPHSSLKERCCGLWIIWYFAYYLVLVYSIWWPSLLIQVWRGIVQTIEFLQPHGNTIFLMSCFFMTNQTQAVQMIPLFLYIIISIAFQFSDNWEKSNIRWKLEENLQIEQHCSTVFASKAKSIKYDNFSKGCVTVYSGRKNCR